LQVQLLHGLCTLAEEQFRIHRDFKPENVRNSGTAQDNADRPTDPTDRGIRCLRTTQRSCSTAATVPPPCPRAARRQEARD
jgi:hypothetical protein